MGGVYVYNNYKTLLKSKEHNPIYIDLYIEHIEKCRQKDIPLKYERHHILPKAKSLFPEYKSFKDNPWNEIKLSREDHFIAHELLALAYPKTGALNAFRYMLTMGNNPEKYAAFRELHSQVQSERIKKWLSENEHPKGMLGKKHTSNALAKMQKNNAGNNNPMYGKKNVKLAARNTRDADKMGKLSGQSKINTKVIKKYGISYDELLCKLKVFQSTISCNNFDTYSKLLQDYLNKQLSTKDILWLFGYVGTVRSDRAKPKEISALQIPNIDLATIF